MIKKVYLDLDGVFADFWGKVCDIFGGEPENNKMIWDRLKDVPNLFLDLKPLPYTRVMFRAIYQKYGDRCEILSSIPRPDNFLVTAPVDKIKWVRRYLNDSIVVNIVSNHSEKQKFCQGKDYVLIDDYAKNINEWNAKGGVGILHEDWNKTYTELVKLGIL